jgi:hypothetical protein
MSFSETFIFFAMSLTRIFAAAIQSPLVIPLIGAAEKSKSESRKRKTCG